MHSHSLSPSCDVSKFRRFRLNLIGFLRLPPDISEEDLREAILECSAHVLADYMVRARQAAAQSGDDFEEMVRQSPGEREAPSEVEYEAEAAV